MTCDEQSEPGPMDYKSTRGCLFCALRAEVEKLQDHRDQHRQWLIGLESRIQRIEAAIGPDAVGAGRTTIDGRLRQLAAAVAARR